EVDVEIQVVETVAGHVRELRAELVDGLPLRFLDRLGKSGFEAGAVAFVVGGEGEDVQASRLDPAVARIDVVAVAVVVAPGIGEREDRLFRGGGRREKGRPHQERGREEGEIETAELHDISRKRIYRRT